MTKEQWRLRLSMYKSGMIDFYDIHGTILQELAKEREEHIKEIERILSSVARGEKLAETLNFDGESELQKERDKAKKLVEAAKGVMLFAEDDGCIVNGFRSIEFVLQLKQSLTEYEKL